MNRSFFDIKTLAKGVYLHSVPYTMLRSFIKFVLAEFIYNLPIILKLFNSNYAI